MARKYARLLIFGRKISLNDKKKVKFQKYACIGNVLGSNFATRFVYTELFKGTFSFTDSL